MSEKFQASRTLPTSHNTVFVSVLGPGRPVSCWGYFLSCFAGVNLLWTNPSFHVPLRCLMPFCLSSVPFPPCAFLATTKVHPQASPDRWQTVVQAVWDPGLPAAREMEVLASLDPDLAHSFNALDMASYLAETAQGPTANTLFCPVSTPVL